MAPENTFNLGNQPLILRLGPFMKGEGYSHRAQIVRSYRTQHRPLCVAARNKTNCQRILLDPPCSRPKQRKTQTKMYAASDRQKFYHLLRDSPKRNERYTLCGSKVLPFVFPADTPCSLHLIRHAPINYQICKHCERRYISSSPERKTRRRIISA